MRRFWPLCLLLVGLPWRHALAEAATLTTYVGGPFNIYIDRPNFVDDGFRIDCGPTRQGCFLLNQKACDANSIELPIAFTLSRGQGSGLAVDASMSRTVYAFLSTTPSCIYSQISGQVGNNPNLLIGSTSALPAGSIFFNGGTRPFVFPRDITTFNDGITAAATTGRFTTREMLRALGLCSDAGGSDTNLSTYFLCIGVDSSNKGGVNNAAGTAATTSTTPFAGAATSSGGDPTGYVQLQADTKAPAAPLSLTVAPRNGRALAQVQFDTTALDVYQINLAYSHDAANITAAQATDGNGDAVGCAAWQGNVLRTSVNVRNQTVGSQAFEVNGLRNEVAHGFCASSQDLLGNTSAPTATQFAVPRFECDLFACYPEPLAPGYCGAGAVHQLWGGMGALLALSSLRRRRRRRQGAAAAGSLRWLPLWAVLVAVASPKPAAAATAAAATNDYRPRSEGPPSAEPLRARPQDRAAEADADAWTAQRKRSYLAAEAPDHAGLNYAPKPARKVRWGAELRLAPLRPRLGGSRVQAAYDLIYARHDGSLVAGRPLSYTLGLEWFFLRRWGLLGPYARVGYWQAQGHTRVCTDAAGAPQPCTADTLMGSVRGNDVASLALVPLAFGAVWRLDPLWAHLRLPVGVACNAGLGYALWWASSGGRPARVQGRAARGGQLSLQLGAQLSLQLDALWQKSRAGAQSAVAGIHLFGAYQFSADPSSMARRGAAKLDVTDRHLFAVGLGLRFF